MINNTIEVTYYTGQKQVCYILLPHFKNSDVLKLAQNYMDSKYGTGKYGSKIIKAKSMNLPKKWLEDYARDSAGT